MSFVSRPPRADLSSVVGATAHLKSNHRVADVADALGLSTRQLRQRFHRACGLSPKAFQRASRFRRSLPLLLEGCSATEVEHALGYSDQAHFNHEFRRCARLTPGEYLAAQRVHRTRRYLIADFYNAAGAWSARLCT